MAYRGPQAWQAAVAAVAVGAGLGAGSAALDGWTRRWQIGQFAAPVGADASAVPRVEARQTIHDFGTIAFGASGSHEFVIRNVGGSALTLSRGSTSCSCTVSDFGPAEGQSDPARRVVPPGGETTVRIEWRGKQAGPFDQRAVVLTDDPRRPELEFLIRGDVVSNWKALPDELTFPRLSASSTARAEVRVMTFGSEPPVVSGATIDHPEADRFFAIATEPLDSAAVASEPGATGGFRLALEVKPGLPLGPLRQIVRVTFAMPEEMTAEVPVVGAVAADLVLAGPGWDSSRQALMLGTVSGKTGRRSRLFLTAKGPQRDAVRPRVREVVPATLGVEVGEPAPIGDGTAVRVPLEIVIPPGSAAVNHLCSQQGPPGRIVLETGHPDWPELTITVCVAIGP